MDIALLNKRIIVLKQVINTDDRKAQTSDWEADFCVWCTVSNESGSVVSGEGLTQASENISFTLRHSRQSAAIKALKNRVLFEGDYYDVLSVDHNSYKGKLIKINCQKVRKSSVR